jgi:Amt family ammonium transporter
MVVMLAVNATGTLRLPAEFELYGMDLHEHGISAYPEYVITALGSPTGLVAQQQQQTVTSSMKAPAPAHGD